MRKGALLLLLILCGLGAFAQTPQQNLDKYWGYRQRLKTDFLHVGIEQGMSMPAENRNTGNHTIKWGDNTIWLGWYIGTLATEYQLLNDPHYVGYNQGDANRVDTTLEELYDALYGLIRLDTAANAYFPSPCTQVNGQRDGFFIRDDVQPGIISYFPGVTFEGSDYYPGYYINEMSQDQVYHVLLGLSMVKKFIPAGTVVHGMDLRAEAIQEATLIVDWVHQHDWNIKNPQCNDSTGNLKDVARGAQAVFYSPATSKALQYITDGAVNYDSTLDPIALSVWATLNQPTNIAYTNVDNLHMAMTDAAIGKGWGDSTMFYLMALADTQKWYAYPLLHVALYDTANIIDYQSYKPLMDFWVDSMLNEAPLDGPHTTYPNPNTFGYSVNNRFIRARSQHYMGTSANVAYNGMDYMLLHNLNLLVNPAEWNTDTTGINEYALGEASLYPNPTNGLLMVNITKGTGDETIQVMDMTGRKMPVPDQPYTQSSHLLQVGGLAPGLYCVLLTNAHGRRAYPFVKYQ